MSQAENQQATTERMRRERVLEAAGPVSAWLVGLPAVATAVMLGCLIWTLVEQRQETIEAMRAETCASSLFEHQHVHERMHAVRLRWALTFSPAAMEQLEELERRDERVTARLRELGLVQLVDERAESQGYERALKRAWAAAVEERSPAPLLTEEARLARAGMVRLHDEARATIRDEIAALRGSAARRAGIAAWAAVTAAVVSAVAWGYAFRVMRGRRLERDAALSEASAERAAREAGQAKAEFIAASSHDLRTPLNGVIGALDLLLARQLDEEARRYGALARTSAESLLTMINGLIDLAALESNRVVVEPVVFEPDQLLKQAVSMARVGVDRRPVSVEGVAEPGLPGAITGDVARLKRVLATLAGVVVRSIPSGRVRVSMRVVAPRGVALRPGMNVRLGFGVHVSGGPEAAVAIDRIERMLSGEKLGPVRMAGDELPDGSMSGSGHTLVLGLCGQLVGQMKGRLTGLERRGEMVGVGFEVPVIVEPVSALAAKRLAELTRSLRVLLLSADVADRVVVASWLGRWGCRSVSADSVERVRSVVESADGTGGWLAIVSASVGSEGLAAVAGELAGRCDGVPGMVVLDGGRELPTDWAGVAGCRCVVVRTVASETVLGAMLSAAGEHGCNGGVQVVGESGEIGGVGAIGKTPVAGRATNGCGAEASSGVKGSDGGDGAESGTPAATARTAFGGSRVLLVDDNPVNAMVGVELLRHAGYVVETASDGQEALAKMSADGFDAVLMDVQMPVMDGPEATRAWRRREQEGKVPAAWSGRVPVVALTANAMPEDRQRCEQAGMSAFLTKPLELARVVATIDRFLAAERSVDAGLRRRGQAAGATFGVVAGREKGAEAGVKEGAMNETGIDHRVLDLAGLDARCMGNRALGLGVVRKLVAGLPGQVQALETSLGAGDLAEVGRVAHSVKGSAATVSAVAVSEAAARVETAARAENAEEAREELKALVQATDQLRAVVARLAEGEGGGEGRRAAA